MRFSIGDGEGKGDICLIFFTRQSRVGLARHGFTIVFYKLSFNLISVQDKLDF